MPEEISKEEISTTKDPVAVVDKELEEKIKEYNKLCKDQKWFFIYTTEGDMSNLRDRLGKKLNETPLKRIMWK